MAYQLNFIGPFTTTLKLLCWHAFIMHVEGKLSEAEEQVLPSVIHPGCLILFL